MDARASTQHIARACTHTRTQLLFAHTHVLSFGCAMCIQELLAKMPKLPAKTWTRTKDDEFVEKRRAGLEELVQGVLGVEHMSSNPDLLHFLNIISDMPPGGGGGGGAAKLPPSSAPKAAPAELEGGGAAPEPTQVDDDDDDDAI